MNSDALASLGWNGRAEAGFGQLARPGLLPGRIVRVERSACIIAGADGDHRSAAPSGVAVGDWVGVAVVAGRFTIEATVNRWSQLVRGDPDGRGRQVLAANVDLVLVTTPADRLSAARVERETAMAWASGARPVVLVTKLDLADDEEVTRLRTRLGGVEVIATSSASGAGVAQVKALLQPCLTAVLIGPSGAGKSSLANALIGSERLATGAVRDGDHRGRHTTTSRQLVAVPGGGVLIDTPGLRSLALTGDAASVDAAFKEIEDLAARCRFGNCRHDREPGCAVVAAVAAGTLGPARLASYRKLKAEVTHDESRDDRVARQEATRVSKAEARAIRGQPKIQPKGGPGQD